MDQNDKEKTPFCCTRVLFEFNVMPFGLCNAPSTYQHLMSIVLRDCGAFAIPYLDDIIIFSPSMDEHLRHLDIVFS